MSDNVMNFAPLHGWLKNGVQDKQSFRGWNVLAQRPKVGATPVVVLTLADYDEMVRDQEELARMAAEW